MRKILALVALALVASCGGSDSTNPTNASIAGTWNLSTVNGAGLPFVFQASNPKIELLNDQIIASVAGTFTETYNIRFTSTTGQVTQEAGADAGTYTISGTAISFRYADGSSGTGTVSGNTFTFAFGGFSQVFVKQ
jgi:hypothetical protein